ncbi:MAG: HAMP domain-containing histidine kinase [bacterium]|nr:HAMP domain-containing histidine kinase [bacterium]
MHLSRHIVSAIIVLIVLSLAGLVMVQSFLLSNARELEEQAFQRNVLAALNAATQKLETGETARRIVITMGAQFSGVDSLGKSMLSIQESMVAHTAVGVWTSDSLSWRENVESDTRLFNREVHPPIPPVEMEERAIRYRVPEKQHVRIVAFSAVSGRDTTLVDTVKLPGDYRIELTDSSFAAQSYIFKFANDSSSILLHVDSTFKSKLPPTSLELGKKSEMVSRVVNNLVFAEMEPIERRVDYPKLDSVLGITLRESGIDLAYAFGVIGNNDSLRMARPSQYREELQASPLRSRLFPNDLFAAANELVVYFPEERSFIWQQVTPLLVATMVFMLIITLCFAYTIRTIMRQRRFAELTVDFINNMTHEFKTPISTVNLAAEALLKSEPGAESKTVRYGKMILDENQRMRNQVDKILQMAVLEEGDFELSLSDVDLHQVIGKAAEHLSLHVEHRDGKVDCRLEAPHHIVKADPVHLSNIISNILDNANKYSPEHPQITISTRNGDGGVFVRISDNGIGIREKDLKQVFDKYYRVPSGNIHNVKGFGLGLAYVKLMVEAHSGRIRIDSQFGKGTDVEIYLPVVESVEQDG